ncbi:hypothetical protein [Methanobrevibacter sp.]|uniref:hypothetical protein n=1 Tax=Methanobrevibacter sp. TaxID=66852 RepID=UPI00388D69F7
MNNINDTDFLTDACLNNPSSHIRLAILNRICDEKLLNDIEMSAFIENVIMSDPDDFIVSTACEKLNFTNSEDVIKFLARFDDASLKPDFIKGITDEYVLKYLALNHKNNRIRAQAILNPNLTDIEVISNVIADDEDYFTRVSAISRIKNCKELEELVYKKSLNHRLAEIVNNITFKTGRYFINEFESADDEYERSVAVMFIEDENILEDIISKENDEKVIESIIRNENFKNKEILIDYVKNNLEKEAITDLFTRITDESFLEDLAINKDLNVRFHAVKQISNLTSNDNLLRRIALVENDEKICINAVESIENRNFLIEIAHTRPEKNIRLSALNQIKAKRLLNNYMYFIQNSLADLPFESWLREMALDDEDSEIRQVAASKLNDKKVLDEIVSGNDEAAPEAQKRLNTLFEDIKQINNGAVLNKLVASSDSDVSNLAQDVLDDLQTWESRIAEISNIDDINQLKNISKNDFNRYVRMEAEGKLERILFNFRLDEIPSASTQEKLKNIALDEDLTFYLRNKAISEISDVKFLKEIIDGDFDENLKNASKLRLHFDLNNTYF